MEFNTSCPACGAVLTLESNSKRVTCGFCGNQFSVDTSSALPALERVIPGEMQPEPLPVQSALTESAETLPPPSTLQPAETLPPIFSPEPVDLPAFTPPNRPVGTPAQRSKFPVWLIVALGVFLLMCGACALMAMFSLFSGFGNGF